MVSDQSMKTPRSSALLATLTEVDRTGTYPVHFILGPQVRSYRTSVFVVFRCSRLALINAATVPRRRHSRQIGWRRLVRHWQTWWVDLAVVSVLVQVSEWVEFHVPIDTLGDFWDESFQAITCTGTDNSKQSKENTPKTKQTENKQKINKLAISKKNTEIP